MEKLLYFAVVLTIFAIVEQQGLVHADQNGTYTSAERKALGQLRQAVKDIVYMDYQSENAYLIHWLRDQDLDVQKAKNKMQKSLKWRKTNNIDTILENKEFIETARKYPFSVEGMDRDGRPLLSYKIREWDIRKYLLSGKVDIVRMKKFQAYMYEMAAAKMRENSAKIGKDVSEWINLVDMNGFNMRQHGCLACVQMFAEILSEFTENYPNFAYKIFYVNAPRALETMMRIFRPVTPPSLLKLTTVYGHDTNEWKPVLLKYLDEDQIPAGFAGANSIVTG